jgi:hypothetical protein
VDASPVAIASDGAVCSPGEIVCPVGVCSIIVQCVPGPRCFIGDQPCPR